MIAILPYIRSKQLSHPASQHLMACQPTHCGDWLALPRSLFAWANFFSLSSSLAFVSDNSACRALMNAMASSTVLALLLLDIAALSPESPSVLPALSLLPLVIGAGGSRLSISFNATLILLRRPCSASLWLVRFELKFSASASGYDTPGRCVPSRMFW
jgi:hypothetical protein